MHLGYGAITRNQLNLAASISFRPGSGSIFIAAMAASPMPSTDGQPLRLRSTVARGFARAAGPQLLVRLITRLPRIVRPGVVVVVQAPGIRIDLWEYGHLALLSFVGHIASGRLGTTVGSPREACHPAQAVSAGQIPRSPGVVPPRWNGQRGASGRKAGRLIFASQTALSGGLQGRE